LVNVVAYQHKCDPVPTGLRTFQFASLNFDVSFQEIYATLSTGGTLVLISEESRRDSYEMLHYLREYEIERLFLPFVALQRLAEVAEESQVVPTSLRQVMTAGEQLQITRSVRYLFSNLPQSELYNQYGPTETHCASSYKLSGDPAQWPALPPIGRPFDNTTLYVLDAHFQPVPPGVPGELYIGGVTLANGYLNQSELSAERFLPNPFVNEPGARMYKTGDLVRYLQDGNLLYLGRIDQQVKVRGYRIELGEVEAVLGQHPDVRELAVTVRPDASGDQRLTAYVVIETGESVTATPVTPNALRDFLKEKLPEYMVPSAFVLLDALPLTPSGKVDRRALPAPEGHEQAETYIAPRDRLECEMVNVWESVLHRSPIGMTDNYFAIGGDSLKAVTLMSAIRKRFDIRLPLATLFQTPTVGALCARLRDTEHQLVQSGGDCLIPIQNGDAQTPPLFLIHPGWGGVLCYATLAKALGEKQSVYGIQAVGYDTDDAALTSIAEMADHYLAEILRVTPVGPYRLGGWSM
ncbi:MAG: AMP-binding protein, partial [Tumebacillaceae bacterium]